MYFDFLIPKRPVSLQTRKPEKLQKWKEFVRAEAAKTWINPLNFGQNIQLTLVYLYNSDPVDIAKKSPTEGYIIEVKKSASQIPIDWFREVAEIVAQHKDWRFLLVTGEDISIDEDPKLDNHLLTWEQMRQRKDKAERWMALGEAEVAFLSFWIILEAAMRQQSINMAIPIERLHANSLINHLYSQGELSIEQFDLARVLQTVRNQFVHGYQTPNLIEYSKQLQELVNKLITIWEKDSADCTR